MSWGSCQLRNKRNSRATSKQTYTFKTMQTKTQAEQLRDDLAKDIIALRAGKMGVKTAKAISSLAGNQIRLAMTEIKYKQMQPHQEIDFFEK